MGRPLPPSMAAMREVYSALSAPTRPVWRGGSWRLPQSIAESHIVRRFLEICAEVGVTVKFCKRNLLETP